MPQNKDEIRANAKKILDSFASQLEKVKLKKAESREKTGGFRKESSGNPPNKEFRKAIFANAPQVEKDCIVAEKKTW